MNILGVDWGKSKVGLAIASEEVKIASPILVLSYHSTEEVIDKLKALIIQEKIQKIVVGQPVSLSGGGKVCREFEAFVSKLSALGPEIVLEDERMSTKLAQAIKKQFQGCKKVGDDDIAAAVILQSYLDKK